MSKPQFEKFRRNRLRDVPSPIIAVRSRKNTDAAKAVFSFNNAAHEALGNPEALELLYDLEVKAVGFRGAASKSDDSYKVRRVGNQFQVSAQAFLDHYGIADEVADRVFEGKSEDKILFFLVDGEET